MKKDPDRDVKIRKLLVAIAERQEQIGELLDEVNTLLGGGVGVAQRLKQAYAKWSELHALRYAGAYLFAFVKDAPNMKRLLKQFGPDDLFVRMAAYIRDDEAYLVRARHPFGLFVVHVNRYAGLAPESEALRLTPDEDRPADCRHVPPCATDQEHTKRRSSEMRNGSHGGPVGDVL